MMAWKGFRAYYRAFSDQQHDWLYSWEQQTSFEATGCPECLATGIAAASSNSLILVWFITRSTTFVPSLSV